MTLPNEEYNSLVAAKNFLYDIINHDRIKGVPSEVRQRAVTILKHFPMQHRLNEIYQDHITPSQSILKEYSSQKDLSWLPSKDE